MLARTQTALMAATRPLRAASASPYPAFTLFLKQQKGKIHFEKFTGKMPPRLSGYQKRLVARAKAIAQGSKILSRKTQPNNKQLKIKAAKIKIPVKTPKLKLKKMTPAYAKFVKKNYKKVSKVSPAKRMAKLAQMYKAAKKQ